MWADKKEQESSDLQKALDDLTHVDITNEIQSHKLLTKYNEKSRHFTDLQDQLTRLVRIVVADQKAAHEEDAAQHKIRVE